MHARIASAGVPFERDMATSRGCGVPVAVAVVVLLAIAGGDAAQVSAQGFQANYLDALRKSILFFEGQRSGKLPTNQRMTWRRDSAVHDGQSVGVDLTGGYYDAGDNVKFGFPMAYTITVLSWAIVEFAPNMGGEINNALEALRWGTDYLLKATSQPNKMFVQVGDPYADHACWERPEDMDTIRTVYSVDPQNPGSEIAGETAAALAAASLVFKSSDPSYAKTLLTRSLAVFKFGDTHRGSYSQSLGKWVCPFYCDFDGYMDELIWAAAWIYKANNNEYYWQYVASNINTIQSSNVGEFGWDDKHAGIYVLLAKKLLASPESGLVSLLQKTQEFACTVLPESPTKTVQYSPGGLLFKSGGSNLQHTTSLSFLLVVYARYLASSNKTVTCSSNIANIPPSRLIEVARGQVDYILGKNPLGMSYMVGYGNKFPQRIHHRGSSLPSVQSHPQKLGCHDGTPYFQSPQPNPNVLVGALVGGPTISDAYSDSRVLFNQSEPTTYLNAPMVGLLAYLSSPSQ